VVNGHRVELMSPPVHSYLPDKQCKSSGRKDSETDGKGGNNSISQTNSSGAYSWYPRKTAHPGQYSQPEAAKPVHGENTFQNGEPGYDKRPIEGK